MRKNNFDAIIINLMYNQCRVNHPDPNINASFSGGETYKQAQNWAQWADAVNPFGSKPWYPDLPLYRVGK